MLWCMGEVALLTVPAAPRIDWDDFGRPLFVHLCQGQRYTERLPVSDEHWWADIVNNTVCPSIACQVCGLHGFWVNGEWRQA